MKKRISILLTAAMVVGLLAGCGGTKTEAPAEEKTEEAAAEEEAPAEEVAEGEYAFHVPNGAKAAETPADGPIKIRVTTTHKPGGTHHQFEQFMQEVFDAEAPGMFELDLYDSGTLFKTDAELPAILEGQVEMSFIQASYFYDNGLPWANMLDMGYLYDSVEHLQATFEPSGETGAEIQQALWDEFHVMTFGADYIGSRNLWLAKDKDVNGPEDVKGLTIRMPTSASFVQLGEALGFNVTALDVSEVYLAMETGLLDGHENQILSTYTNGQFEVCETLVFIKHMLTPNLITLSGDAWESMTEEQQRVFYNCICKVRDMTTDWVVDMEQEYIGIAENDYNIRLQYPDRTGFKEQVQNYYLGNSTISGAWNIELLDKINALAETIK